jgi:hypothetical protein
MPRKRATVGLVGGAWLAVSVTEAVELSVDGMGAMGR